MVFFLNEQAMDALKKTGVDKTVVKDTATGRTLSAKEIAQKQELFFAPLAGTPAFRSGDKVAFLTGKGVNTTPLLSFEQAFQAGIVNRQGVTTIPAAKSGAFSVTELSPFSNTVKAIQDAFSSVGQAIGISQPPTQTASENTRASKAASFSNSKQSEGDFAVDEIKREAEQQGFGSPLFHPQNQDQGSSIIDEIKKNWLFILGSLVLIGIVFSGGGRRR